MVTHYPIGYPTSEEPSLSRLSRKIDLHGNVAIGMHLLEMLIQ